MPQKRKPFRRFRLRRRRRKKKNTLKKRVRRLESNVEKKYDIQVASPDSPGVPNSYEMANNLGDAQYGYDKQIIDITPDVNQGITDTTRIGDQLTLKKMNFQCVATYQPDASLPASGKIGVGDVAHCRIIVVQDNVPTYSGPSNTTTGAPTLLHNPLYWNHVLGVNAISGTTQTPCEMFSAYKYDTVTRGKRVNILHDEKFTLVAGTARSVKQFSFTKRWLNKKLKYLGGGDAPINKHLNVLFLSNRASDECPIIYFQTQYVYTDE